MTDHRRDNIMPHKRLMCDGCHKIMRSDYLTIHKKICKKLNQNDDDKPEDDTVAFDHLSSEKKRHPGGKIVVEIDFANNMGVCACGAQKRRALISQWKNGKKFYLLVKREELTHLNLL